MIWKIAKKEFLLNLMTFKFGVGMIIFTGLCLKSRPGRTWTVDKMKKEASNTSQELTSSQLKRRKNDAKSRHIDNPF